MALTVQRALARIQHGYDGNPSRLVSGLDMLNEAGELMSQMHAWRWLSGRTVDLELVQGRDYIEVPLDVAQITSLHRSPERWRGTLQFTTLETIHRLRADLTVATSDFVYVGALGYRNHPDGQGAQRPVIEVWPSLDFSEGPDEPGNGSVVSNAAQLMYRAGWSYLSQESDIISIPQWMEHLYLAIVVGVAEEYDQEGIIPRGQYGATIRQSPLFEAAIRRDTSMQPDYGVLPETLDIGGQPYGDPYEWWGTVET